MKICFAVSALALVGCGGSVDSAAKRQDPSSAANEPITITRSGCLGTCVAYSVKIDPSGGEFDGKFHTAVKGKKRFAFTPDLYRKVAEVLAPLRSQGMHQIDNGDPRCGSAATDMPGWGVTWGSSDDIRSVDILIVNGGCQNPAAAEIGKRIESAERMIPIDAMKRHVE